MQRIMLIVLGASLSSACAWQPPEPATAPVRAPAAVAWPEQRPAAPARTAVGDPLAAEAATIAARQVGTPYRYGGTGPSGFDCSGLVQYAYRAVGVRVPRTTAQLWRHATPIDVDRMQRGDLLFFNIDGKPSHVGIYLGDDRFVHAPSSGRRVTTESLHAEYYSRRLLRAGRVPGGNHD